VRLRGKQNGDAKRENWLLIKGKDEYADSDGDAAIEKFQKSVVSRRNMEGIAKASGNSWGAGGKRKKTPSEAADAVKALKKRTPQSSHAKVNRLRSARETRQCARGKSH
jgi:bifunctional non-homologous end joining protein LigD